jgi:hypothetical protein
MSKINERQIALRKGGTNATLDLYLDNRVIRPLPFVESQKLVVSNAQFIIVPASVMAGTLAVGVNSIAASGSYIVAPLVGAIGNAATTNISDSNGNILNMIKIRSATPQDELAYDDAGEARSIYGLLQCVSTAADDNAITEGTNLQISFVYYAANGTLTLCAVNGSIEFQANKMYKLRDLPTIYMEGGNIVPDILQSGSEPLEIAGLVIAAFATNEVITLSNGVGAGSGSATASLDTTMPLHASAALFNADRRCSVQLNGAEQIKGTDFIWDSTTTGHFAFILDVGDYYKIKTNT